MNEPEFEFRADDADYRREYAKNREEFMQARMSEADYVQSRRIDDGKEELLPANMSDASKI